jgi:hypothetical protein
MLRGQVECCDRSRSHELRQRDQAHNWPKRSKPACFLTQKQSTTPGRTPASPEIMLPPYLPPSLQPNDIKSLLGLRTAFDLKQKKNDIKSATACRVGSFSFQLGSLVPFVHKRSSEGRRFAGQTAVLSTGNGLKKKIGPTTQVFEDPGPKEFEHCQQKSSIHRVPWH